MGNVPTIEYPVGAVVEARYDGNQTKYYAAKIVKKHEYGRYDVKFQSNNKIVTVFWDDIKQNGAGGTIETSPSKAKSSLSTNAQSLLSNFPIFNRNKSEKANVNKKPAKTVNIALNLEDNDIKDEHAWNELIENIDLYLENNEKIKIQFSLRKNNNFNMKQLVKFERLLFAIGGDQLCENIILSNKEKTCTYITKCIQNATKQKNDDIKYIHQLKSIDIVSKNSDKSDMDNTVWDKYGLNYKLSMDLDYDQLVNDNNKFRDEIVNELSLILQVNPSLIDVVSMRKGSIIIECALCAVGIILLLFGYWSMDKISYLVKKTLNRKVSGGEKLLGLNPGDQVLVDWDNQMFDAKVIEKFQNMNESWIRVEYVGKPFIFQNTEKLELSSSRLHIKEPGYQYEANIYPDVNGNVSFEVLPKSNSGE